MGNGLRMPFAQWLGHMADNGLAAPGRVIAIYASVFSITSNEDLSRITGVEGRTLDKWKKTLVGEGWVLIPPCRGGRGRGIEVIPAYKSEPVNFTDMKQKDPGKYCTLETPAIITGVNDDDTPAINTPVISATPAKITPVIFDQTPAISAQTPAIFAPLSAETPAEITPVKNTGLARAYKELPSEVLNIQVVSEVKEEKKEVGFDAVASPALDALHVFESYNELAQRVGLPVARSLTPQRRKAILARLKEHGGAQSWEAVLSNIARSAFLQGRNDRGWRPTGLDWFLNPANFTKVYEGAYGNGAHAYAAPPKETEWERMSRLMGDPAPAPTRGEIEILPPVRRA